MELGTRVPSPCAGSHRDSANGEPFGPSFDVERHRRADGLHRQDAEAGPQGVG